MNGYDPSHHAKSIADAQQSINEFTEAAAGELTGLGRDSSRWLLSTFLALNSGGIVTSFSQANDLNHPLLVASLFFVGVTLSLFTAIWISISTSMYLRRIRDVQISAKSWNLQTTAEEMRAANIRLLGLSWTLATPIFTGLGSGIVFILAAATFVWGQKPENAANSRRCLAIQHDMLSARPRRADGPDLFQALGCRPQGQGSIYAPPRMTTGAGSH